MDETGSDQQMAAFGSPLFSVSLRGKRVDLTQMLLVLLACLGVFTATTLWFHREDVGKISAAFRELTIAQQEMNYIISLPQDKRERLNLQMPPSLRERVRRIREKESEEQ